MNSPEPTPLIIIGAGAAGLMAACQAGELGIPCILLERKHRLGSKILMCGNGRCNLTSTLTADDMLADFGQPLSEFLRPALTAFSPTQQQNWFKNNNLPLMRTSDGKIFPKSEKAADVVRCFSTRLRMLQIPICLNAPASAITPLQQGFRVDCPAFSLQAKNILLATGGVSYPKTGSVGDGQKFAKAMGHQLQPYRPGLVGIEYKSAWHSANLSRKFKQTQVKIFDGQKLIGTTKGLLECERWGLGGGAISNATRLLARSKAKNPALEIQTAHNQPPFRVAPVKTRPLKEAMVTVGGIDLTSVDPATMQSTRHLGLYFAGEVLDVDGPTGGYNLTAAFATARLAIQAIAKTGHFTKPTPAQSARKSNKGSKRYLNNRKSTTGGRFKRRHRR